MIASEHCWALNTQCKLKVHNTYNPPIHIRREAEYTVDRSPTYQRANTVTTIRAHIYLYGQLRPWPINPSMSLDCGRKPENPCRRRQIIHTERPQTGFKLRIALLWGAVLTNVPLYWNMNTKKKKEKEVSFKAIFDLP